MFKTRMDIPEVKRTKLIALLNASLADALDLYSQVKYAHWNVKGPSFISLHKLFDEVAEAVEEHIDTIAERATALGGVADGTVRQAAQRSSLPEYPLNISEGARHVEALAGVLARFGASVRRAIAQSTELDDADTADLFTQVSRDIDKYLWFVEAHAQAER